MSKAPWCVLPSSPTIPARSAISPTGRFCRHTSWTIWSKARCRNVEYMDTNGFNPLDAIPAAILTAFCSAIPTSNTRSGNSPRTSARPGPLKHRRAYAHHVIVLPHDAG